MPKLRILFADTDVAYIASMERKAIEEFEDNADLNIITDPAYIETFFSIPQVLDVMVVQEQLYNPEFEKHNIGHIYILTEDKNAALKPVSATVSYIYKYSSIKDIFAQIMNNPAVLQVMGQTQRNTQVIMTYSAAGGTGQTTIALGLAAALAKNYKKVLFLALDSLQALGTVLPDITPLKHGSEKGLLTKSEYCYEAVKTFVLPQSFYILPPFAASLSALGLHAEHYINLLNCIRKEKEYDYLIVDGPDNFSHETTALMSNVDRTLIVAGQSKVRAAKHRLLLENIDCSDRNRFTMVCNNYRPDRDNHLLDSETIFNYEYVEQLPEIEYEDIDKVGALPSMQKLALLLL